MTETTNPRIERALAAVDRELARTRDERAAFVRFRERLEDVAITGGRTDGGVATRRRPVLGHDRPRERPVREVEDAYRETVMATPHYDEEYGDGFERSLAEEFGEGIAAALTGADRLAPELHRTLLRAADHSRRERSDFLSLLGEERESLERIDGRLSGIESSAVEGGNAPFGGRSFEDLMAARERLLELEGDCRRLARDRQEEIHGRSLPRAAGIGDVSLVGYLYAGFDATCPALADVMDVLDGIRDRRRRCERELSRPG